MIKLNDNFQALPPTYLFAGVGARVAAFRESNPEVDIVRMDIGDVTQPVCAPAIEAMHAAVADMADASTFRGYGPEQGYPFLREAIARCDYQQRGIDIAADEIFIGDGAKSDIGNFPDILGRELNIAVTDPVYPVYVDSNVMDGHGGSLLPDGRWSGISYLPLSATNGFVPDFPATAPGVVYLCSPNNPTGTTLGRDALAAWVDYCRANGVLMLFDSAYEAYIRHADVPRSIYEIEGAREVAVEFRSFSKTAGFTGLRCGYTVVPRSVVGRYSDGSTTPLHGLWLRRQCTKFNGASYIVQRGAEALYSPRGRECTRRQTELYLGNASMLRNAIGQLGLTVAGGIDSPYVWFRAGAGIDSWQLFDRLLSAGVTSTPGSGFGPSGAGYVRLTGFNTPDNTRQAISRIRALLA